MGDSLLISGAAQIVTVRGRASRRGNQLRNIGVIRDGAILVRDGVIVAVGPSQKVEKLAESKKAEKMDVGGRVVLPGFVDSHTHLIHAASRAEEYELKIQGTSYEEIASKGGGILNSVKKLRAANAVVAETIYDAWNDASVQAWHRAGFAPWMVHAYRML